MIELAHQLGIEVMADGLEREQEAGELGRLGCEYGQGTLFGEPLTAEECRALIEPSPAEARAAAAHEHRAARASGTPVSLRRGRLPWRAFRGGRPACAGRDRIWLPRNPRR